jgi:hypothetical protein
MRMTYTARGADTSAIEVTNISKHGFWLLLGEREVFLPFETFPWFREAPVGKVLHVELPSEHHLYWPELDIDLEVESLFHPERYPLASKVHEARERYVAPEREENVDPDRIDDCVLALLRLILHDGDRAWKGFDYEVMDRLFEKGYILNPRGKSKSVVFTEEGLARAERLFGELFGKR